MPKVLTSEKARTVSIELNTLKLINHQLKTEPAANNNTSEFKSFRSIPKRS